MPAPTATQTPPDELSGPNLIPLPLSGSNASQGALAAFMLVWNAARTPNLANVSERPEETKEYTEGDNF